MNRTKSLFCSIAAAVGLGLLPLVLARGQEAPKNDDASSFTIVQGHSDPSATTKPAFSEVGKVKEIFVKPGDVIKVGQVLGTLDSDMDQADYNLKKIAAESSVEIEYATVDRDAKKLIYERKKAAGENATPLEVQEAKLDWDQAEIKIKAAEEKQQESQADLAKQAIKLEKMKLISPMDGIVKDLKVHPGEMADPAKPDGAMTLVQTQPLWVDIHVKSGQAARLKVGQELTLSYANEPTKWITGSIIYFDPVSNAMSDQQTVRLELKNEEAKPAGWLVNVRLPWPASTDTDGTDRTAIGR
jgi:RND family efflux transporter MFP subunit